MLNHLLRNYYEIHGNFNKISNHPLSRLIPADVESVEEFCYQALGYGIESSISAVECHDLRMAVLTEDLTTVSQKYNISSMEEAKKILEKEGFLPELTDKNRFNVRSSLLKYSNVLADYYKNTPRVVCEYEGQRYPISHLVKALKFKPKRLTKEVTTICENNKDAMADIVKDATDDIYVSHNILHVDKELNEKQKFAIQVDALKIATGLDTRIPVELVMEPLKFILLAVNNPLVYLSLLEDAEMQGITYADLVAPLGIQIFDYYPLYKAFHAIIIRLNDKSLVINDVLPDNKHYVLATDQELSIILNQINERVVA